jgi:hypothetical protein
VPVAQIETPDENRRRFFLRTAFELELRVEGEAIVASAIHKEEVYPPIDISERSSLAGFPDFGSGRRLTREAIEGGAIPHRQAFSKKREIPT